MQKEKLVQVTAMFSESMVQRLDKYAVKERRSRASAIRYIVEVALLGDKR